MLGGVQILKSLPLRAADFPPDPSSAPVAPCSSMKTSLGSLARGACGRMGEVSALAPQNVPRGRDVGFSAGAGFVLRSLPVCLPRHSILPGSSSRRTRAEWPQAPGLERGLAGMPRTARAPAREVHEKGCLGYQGTRGVYLGATGVEPSGFGAELEPQKLAGLLLHTRARVDPSPRRQESRPTGNVPPRATSLRRRSVASAMSSSGSWSSVSKTASIFRS